MVVGTTSTYSKGVYYIKPMGVWTLDKCMNFKATYSEAKNNVKNDDLLTEKLLIPDSVIFFN